MLFEPTTLSSVARLIGESLLEDYGIDPQPLFDELQVDTGKFLRPGARTPYARMDALWRRAVEVTGDPWFGFMVGERATPNDFFVFGHAWLASATLRGALLRLCRYGQVISNVNDGPVLHRKGAHYALTYPNVEGQVRPTKYAKDAGLVVLVNFIDIVTSPDVRPEHVSLTLAEEHRSERYNKLFGCPVTFGCDEEVWLFAAEDLDRSLPGSVPDITEATDRIARNYIDGLDSSKVATEVSRLLVQMLPSGRVDQSELAARLHRSKSTLQRQLSAEGTSYRDILESTRRLLAERYLEEGEHTQAQVAFMTGFSDQSNFARAFKRWTGMSPGKFQKAARH
ncbi:MAG: AraC family transcriptional regulator [Woeseiaceae bacterium]